MARTRSFSVFLLKKDILPTDALEPDNKLESVNSSTLPEGSLVFLADNPPNKPWWSSYFSISKTITQSSKAAIVFLSSNDRWFALCFGHVAHNLVDDKYEHDFGLLITLNAVDPDKLRSTDILEPGESRRRRTQLPSDSELTMFDFDRDVSILRRLSGKTKAVYSDFFKQSTGASNVRITSDAEVDDLVDLCEKLLEIYQKDDYLESFKQIYKVQPVRDPSKIEKLNGVVEAKIREKSEEVGLAIPDIVNLDTSLYIDFSGAGRSPVYDDVFIGSYYEYLGRNKKKSANDITVADLKKHKMRLTDEEGNPRQGYPVYRCLIADLVDAETGNVSHLTEGQWYEFDGDFVNDIGEELDQFFVASPFPPYDHASEADYNSHVPTVVADAICLDQKNISPSGESAVEPCDVLIADKVKCSFVHIKRSTTSKLLSHLFNQGVVPIQLLKLDEDTSERLSKLVTDIDSDYDAGAVETLCDAGKLGVAYGIVTHKDPALKSKNLPLFSRLSAKRAMNDLKIMGAEKSIFFIKDEQKSSGPKDKPRKPRAKKSS